MTLWCYAEATRNEYDKELRRCLCILASVSTSKTKTLDAREESFNFLGFTIRLTRSTRTGNLFALAAYSDDSGHLFRADSGQSFRRNPATLMR